MCLFFCFCDFWFVSLCCKTNKRMNNQKLNRANKAKNDEFYTKLTDIEKELMHYKEMFVGKTIYCNCDDPVKSNFVQWFYMRFNILHLKRIIVTAYNSATYNGGGIIGIPILLQWTRKLLTLAKKLRRMSGNSTATVTSEVMNVSSC